MTEENMINLHGRMLPTRRGSNTQPPDHQSGAHPTEPPRPAYTYLIAHIDTGVNTHAA